MAASPRKKALLALLSVAVSAGFLYWVLRGIDSERALQVLRGARPGWLALALGATCCVPLCCVVRWRGVLRTHAETHLPFGIALRAVLMANVINSFVPSKGGDIAKAAYLRRRAGVSQGVGTVVLERLVDLSVLGCLGLLGYLASGQAWGLLAAGLLLGGVAGVFCIALFLPVRRLPLPEKIAAKFEALARVFHRWVRSPAAIAQTLAGSFGVWTLAGLTVCALIAAFDVQVSWAYAYAIFPLCVLAGLWPTTISGLGTRDKAFQALLALQGAGAEEAALVALGYTLFAYWILSLISLPAVTWQLGVAARERTDAANTG